MSERTAPGAAMRFVEDLKTLRLQHDVSLEAIHSSTRIPLDVLEKFETSALRDNRLFNRVYLRSLVRAYADAVGISGNHAIDALDDALEGRYDGALLRPPEPDEQVYRPAAVADELHEVGKYDEEAVGDERVLVAREPQHPDVPVAASMVDAPPADPPRHVPPHQQEDVAGTAPVAWDAVSGSTRSPRVSRSETPWGGILIGLLVLVLVGAGVFWWLRSPGDSFDEASADADLRADTTVQQATSQPVAPVSLPDTLQLQVTATNGAISDIKIQVDDDLRRPYWFEQGNSRSFRFVNRVTVERELEDATLTVQGQPYPTTRRDSLGRVVLTRDVVREFLQETQRQ